MKASLAMVMCVALMALHAMKTSAKSKLSLWTVYTDKVSATCVSLKLPRDMNSLLRERIVCVNLQQHYLQCVQRSSLMTSFQDHKQPCGWIDSGITEGNRLRWSITVNSEFSLIVTFRKFHLAMPAGKCTKLQSSENLILSSFEDPKVNRNGLVLFWCGRRTPFTLAWTRNRLFLSYLRLPSSTDGEFLLGYQVGDKMHRIKTTHILDHPPFAKRKAAFAVKLNSLAHFKMQITYLYSIHLLGDKLRLLDFGLKHKSFAMSDFKIGVFEGP